MRKIIIFLVGTCLVFGWAPYVDAQSYPARPIEFVVHSGPASGADIFARVVSDIIAKNKLLPKPVTVVNKVGGGAAVALNYLAERNDPHNIFVVATTVYLTAFMRAKIQANREEFKPIALLGEDLTVIAVKEESPYKTAKDLVEAAKEKPKKIIAGGGSAGGTGQLVVYLFGKAGGVEFSYLPHKGGADAVVSLLGGRVDMVPENPSEMMSHLKAKRVRIVCIASEERLEDLPDVPTLRELGYPAVLNLGRGFLAPKGASDEVVQCLISVFKKTYETPAFQEYLKENMMRPVFITGKELVNYLDGLYNQIYPIIKELGMLHK